LRGRGVVKSVVFFSGLSDAGVEQRARAQGVYVHKSEGINRLRIAVSAAIQG
jgi:hypothetical protein